MQVFATLLLVLSTWSSEAFVCHSVSGGDLGVAWCHRGSLQGFLGRLAHLLVRQTLPRPVTHLASKSDDDVAPATAFSKGTLVEFHEKNREHIGKIVDVEHKSNGGARYNVQEYPSGTQFSIADKEVNFSVPAPTNPNHVDKLLAKLDQAHSLEENELREVLEMSPELLELAWEETLDEEDSLTPQHLIELVHSHSADAIEKYEAWRLLKSEIGHIFFKELKENGRVVAFKAKPRKSVDASKTSFCASHEDDDDGLCDAPPSP